MMDAICLLNNRALFEKYERAQGRHPGRDAGRAVRQ